MTTALLRKLVSWRQLPARVQWLFPPTWCLLGVARLAILILPFHVIARWLGAEAGVAPFTPVINTPQTLHAQEIGQAIQLAADYTPWQSLCQPQALVARFWLGLYDIPYIVNYGLRKEERGGLAAHAWVCAGPVAVTGGQAWDDFVVVRSFAGNP